MDHASSPSSVSSPTLDRLNIESVARRGWLPWLDAGRILAACGVIWIHTPRSEPLTSSVALGRFAVPFFVGTSVLLVVRALQRDVHRDLLPYARGRTERLIYPFVGWSLIYLLFKLAKKWVAPDQPNDLPGWEAIFLGTAYHLWFLPFLWAVSIVSFLVARWSLTREAQRLCLVAGVAFGSLIAWLPYPADTTGGDATYFMWLALPAVCWSFALAIAWPELSKKFDPNLRLHICLSVWAFSTGVLWFLGRSALLESLAGISFLVMALDHRPGRWTEATESIAKLAFGVYLSHLLFLKVGETILARLQIGISPWMDLALFAGVLWMSLGASSLLQKSRYSRWLLG